MAQTTTTTLTTVVPTELILREVIDEARPFNVVAPLVLNKKLPSGQGKVMSIPKRPTTTAAAVGESSDISATARTSTEANITVSEIGDATDLTLLSRETATVMGDIVGWAQAQFRGMAQKVTSDLCDLFPTLGGSSAVGSTGVAITIANFLTAMYRLDSNNAPGPKSCVLHPKQLYDLLTAIAASTGTPLANLNELAADGKLGGGIPLAGYAGTFFGVPTYQTTECETANSGADRTGAMFVKEAMAYVELRPMTLETEADASARSIEVVSHMCYGVGEVVDAYGVPIVTDA